MSFMKNIRTRRPLLSVLALLILIPLLLGAVACGTGRTDTGSTALTELSIENGSSLTMYVGESVLLTTNAGDEYDHLLTWSASGDAVTVSSLGFVSAKEVGTATVTVSYGKLGSAILISVTEAPNASFETETVSESQPDGSSQTEPESTEESVTPPAPDTVEDADGESVPESGPDLESESDALAETIPETPPETALVPETEPETAVTSETETEPEIREPIPEELGSPTGYKPADSYEEALERSRRGELSGYLWLPDQEPNIDSDRPMQDGKYVRNSLAYFADDNTYVVVDSDGDEVFRVYRGGGYITLEEVAAYLYAFGDVPANYISGKKTSVGDNIWGENLRVNHSEFSGSTTKYPYEPELPRISGCGGDLQYYEIDIGTTGTDCDPSYDARPYNNGTKITRGAARIVYARFDANGNKVIDPEEKYIFYTYNHYNDFREYLNYYNGWGEMFGNITGGGTLSSKYDYNPTPYIPVVLAPVGNARTGERAKGLFEKSPSALPKNFIAYIDNKRQPLFWEVALLYIHF